MTVAYSLGQESRTKWEKWPALPRYIRLKAQLLLSRTQQLYCLCSDVHVGQMYSCISRLRKLIALGNWTKKKYSLQALFSLSTLDFSSFFLVSAFSWHPSPPWAGFMIQSERVEWKYLHSHWAFYSQWCLVGKIFKCLSDLGTDLPWYIDWSANWVVFF